MLIGMGLTFAAIGTLAAVGGAWAVRVNDYGRLLALILLTVSGLTLLSETVAGWITRPIVALGSRLLRLRKPEPGAVQCRRSYSESRRDFCGLHVRARYSDSS